MKYPFEEKKVHEDSKSEVVLRVFCDDSHEDEFQWHWDEQERIVYPLHETDWLFQYDNYLPQTFEAGNGLKIQKGQWHRIIKGKGDLNLIIVKKKDI